MEEFEIISPNDRTALVAVAQPEVLALARQVLSDLGYKVHSVDDHIQFDARFAQVSYHVVLLEETFGGGSVIDNPTLQLLQEMPMGQRRHAVIILIGRGFDTLNTLQAFSHSVHCVINHAELPMLAQVVQKTTAENDLFLNTYRDIDRRIHQKA